MSLEQALQDLERADRALASEDFGQPEKLAEAITLRADAIAWLNWAATQGCTPEQRARLERVIERGAVSTERLRVIRNRTASEVQQLDGQSYVLRRFGESS